MIIDDYFSAAEVFSALAASLDQYHTTQKLPGQVDIIRPFGPMEMPVVKPGFEQIPGRDVLELATAALLYIKETNHLNIGASSQQEQFHSMTMESYPSVNEANIISEVAACKDWPVHRENLDMGQLIEMTKLQLWTLKPALQNDNI